MCKVDVLPKGSDKSVKTKNIKSVTNPNWGHTVHSSVVELCRNLPLYINLSTSDLSGFSVSPPFQSSGQLWKTWCAISEADVEGENRKSCLFPSTNNSRRFICQ